MKYLGSLKGVLSQINLCLDSIVPFIHWLVSLLEACEKIKPSPHFIWSWLAELFKLLPNCNQGLALHWTSSRKHTGPCQKHHSKQLPSCIAFSLVTLSAYTQGCSHTSSAIYWIPDIDIIYYPIHLRTFYAGHEHIWDNLCWRWLEKDFWVLFLVWAWGLFLCARLFLHFFHCTWGSCCCFCCFGHLGSLCLCTSRSLPSRCNKIINSSWDKL